MEIESDWYESAFGEDYIDRYAHRGDEEARQGFELVLRTTGLRPPCQALDLCCGAGRHLLAFREAGFGMNGGDLSLPLLHIVRQKLDSRSLGSPLVRLDMRSLPFAGGSFDLVTNFFTAFGYFDADEENYRVLEEVSRVLRPGGFFVLDFLSAPAVVVQTAALPARQTHTTGDGTAWEVRRGLSPDGRRVVKAMRPLDPAGGSEIRESLRLFTPEELKAALSRFGIQETARFGDYHGHPYRGAESPRCLLVGMRE